MSRFRSFFRREGDGQDNEPVRDYVVELPYGSMPPRIPGAPDELKRARESLSLRMALDPDVSDADILGMQEGNFRDEVLAARMFMKSVVTERPTDDEIE